MSNERQESTWGEFTLSDSTVTYNDVKRPDRPHISRREYEEDLKRRQQEHLDGVEAANWQPCMHDACSDCVGTGIRKDGGACVHHMSCPCPKCTVYL